MFHIYTFYPQDISLNSRRDLNQGTKKDVAMCKVYDNIFTYTEITSHMYVPGHCPTESHNTLVYLLFPEDFPRDIQKHHAAHCIVNQR